MRKYIGIILLLIAFILGFHSSGECQSFDADKIEIVSVKSMQVRTEGENYFMDLIINMRNTNPKTLKLRDNTFMFALAANEDTGVRLGIAKPGDIILESAISPDSPSTEVKFSIDMGSDVNEGLKKLTYVVNSVGNPKNSIKISLDGSCAIGTKTKKGWIYQSGFMMELTFSPKIQREILFE